APSVSTSAGPILVPDALYTVIVTPGPNTSVVPSMRHSRLARVNWARLNLTVSGWGVMTTSSGVGSAPLALDAVSWNVSGSAPLGIVNDGVAVFAPVSVTVGP